MEEKCIFRLRRFARIGYRLVIAPIITYLDESTPILGTKGRGPARHAWEAVGFVIVLYTAVVVPLQVAFETSFTPAAAWTLINVASDSFFLLDMGVSLRTAFMRDGAMIQDSKRVAQHYLQGEFSADLLVSLPYVWVLQPLFSACKLPTAARLVPMLRLLRTLLRLYRVESSGQLLSSLSLLRYNPGLVRVGQLMLMLLLACHWAGCLWWLVGEIDMEGRHLALTEPLLTPWAASEWVRAQSFVVRYAHCLLWGAGLMTTLMPFDVLPHTISETVVTTALMVLGLFINVFVISATTTALQNMDAKFMAGRQKVKGMLQSPRLLLLHTCDWPYVLATLLRPTSAQVEMISKYLIYKKVPAKLSTKIISFYDYRVSIAEQSAQLGDLPHELAMQVCAHAQRIPGPSK